MASLESEYQNISGLTDRSKYKIFYSPVRPADILVLGMNPGGNPEAIHRNGYDLIGSLTGKASASPSYYENYEHDMLDCEWKENITKDLIQRGLSYSESQIRQNVVKTNLCFRRSQGADDFRNRHPGMTLAKAYREASPIVREIWGIVRPKTIILEGSLFDDCMRTLGLRDRKDNNHPLHDPIKTLYRGACVDLFRAHEVYASSNPTLVIQLAHPSRFGHEYFAKEIDMALQNLISAK